MTTQKKKATLELVIAGEASPYLLTGNAKSRIIMLNGKVLATKHVLSFLSRMQTSLAASRLGPAESFECVSFSWGNAGPGTVLLSLAVCVHIVEETIGRELHDRDLLPLDTLFKSRLMTFSYHTDFVFEIKPYDFLRSYAPWLLSGAEINVQPLDTGTLE